MSISLAALVFRIEGSLGCTCSLAQVIKRFATQLDEWLHLALDELPQALRNIKFDRECHI